MHLLLPYEREEPDHIGIELCFLCLAVPSVGIPLKTVNEPL